MGTHQVLAAQAADVTTSSGPGGLFLLAWGLFASAFGLLAVTNFRGFTDTMIRLSRRQTTLARLSPTGDPETANKAIIKIVSGVFLIAGPVMIVVGILSSVHGHFTIPEGPVMPAPFRYFFLAVAVVVIISNWTPRLGGYALSAARRGGWRRAVAVLSSAGGAVFAVCVAYGYLTVGIAVWLVCGLAGFFLFFKDSPGHRRT